MKTLFEQIETAKKYAPGAGAGALTESEERASSKKTAQALEVARHLAEASPKPDTAVQLGAHPVAN